MSEHTPGPWTHTWTVDTQLVCQRRLLLTYRCEWKVNH